MAVEPLRNLKDFLPQWRALIANKPAGKRTGDWDTEEDRWLREVVRRLEGAAGLAKVARSTRRADDLRAWCKSLVDVRDWEAALTAFEEAAELVTDKDHTRGEFLDGAALAAQTLGLEDLAAHLERAWRASPSPPRLRRWLGASNSRATLGKRVAEAREACPKQAARQHALLHVLSHDFAPAAKLLATSRALVLASMKKAAESRVAGVTDQKRRRHYGHAAGLVATCVACDTSSATARWAAALKAEYRRFPALREELDRAMGAS